MMNRNPSRTRHQPNRRGLTLLEMLLVVFILSTLALSAMSLTDGLDQQFRFDETTNRRNQIRAAIVIDPKLQIDGRSVVSGFANDLGRLPNNLQELAEQGKLPSWQYDANVDQWAGWRGPYVNAVTESATGTKAFRDGWGNVDLVPANDKLFFGWNFAVDQTAGTLLLQSFGQDRVDDKSQAAGNDIYDLDFPAAGDLLVRDADHRVSLMGWSAWVEFVNVDTKAVTLPDRLRIRVYYPREQGNGLQWPVAAIPAKDKDRDDAEYLSLDTLVPVSQRTLQAGARTQIRFDFTDNGAKNAKLIPAGRRSLAIVDDFNGNEFNPKSTNRPSPITLLPRVGLPTSTSSTPLFRWDVVK